MKKFFFRLETLLKIRTAREGRMQRELSFQVQRHEQHREKKGTLEKQIAELLDAIRIKRKEGERTIHYEQILDHLNLSLGQVENTLHSHAKQLEEMQERLKQTVLERKIIEKIKEKHYAGWRTDLENSEEALLDEFAGRK